MVKIKREVEMTHEEYAKYMIDRFGITSYESALIDNNIIDAPMEFEQTFTLKSMRKDDDPVIERSFKGVVIEVEEEITEETVHTMLIAIYKHPTLRKIFSHRDNTSIRQFKDLENDDVDSFYMLNDDSTMTLIWRDGKLVE